MKKANVILSAIGLLSVIGGAVAFKAQHRFSGTLRCYTSNNISLINRVYTTAGSGANFNCKVITQAVEYSPSTVTVKD